jgi:predicted transcriptional regulator
MLEKNHARWAMDFHNAARLGTYLSKSYAREFFELLVTYKDISASEAASRLNLHIQTAQDFLESLASLGILSKVEVFEKKRPYFRYTLEKERIHMELDLTTLKRAKPISVLPRRIRERQDAGARFSTARNDNAITSIVIWTGEGRDRKERKINLTTPQGKFIYHLPFPNAEPMSVQDLMRIARLEEALAPEIVDMVNILKDLGVIEMM